MGSLQHGSLVARTGGSLHDLPSCDWNARPVDARAVSEHGRAFAVSLPLGKGSLWDRPWCGRRVSAASLASSFQCRLVYCECFLRQMSTVAIQSEHDLTIRCEWGYNPMQVN